LGGLDAETAFVFDPATEDAPQRVSIAELLLAWSAFDYLCAVLEPAA
jgi:hypothetical protein